MVVVLAKALGLKDSCSLLLTSSYGKSVLERVLCGLGLQIGQWRYLDRLHAIISLIVKVFIRGGPTDTVKCVVVPVIWLDLGLHSVCGTLFRRVECLSRLGVQWSANPSGRVTCSQVFQWGFLWVQLPRGIFWHQLLACSICVSVWFTKRFPQ